MIQKNAGLRPLPPFLLAAVCAFLMLFNFNVSVHGDGETEPEAFDASQIQKFSTDELRDLVAPVALYPDALLSQVFQASTYETQLVDAYRYSQSSATPTVPPESAAWDPSVVALLNYPTVLKKLNDDLNWTEKLGVAVTYQMPEVSDTVQQVRAEAQAAGNLVSNDKQQVVQDGEVITIVPAQENVIYVPSYEPDVIFVRHDSWVPFITFGAGYGVGSWLENRWDWHQHRFWRYESWRPGGWYRPSRPIYWRAPARTIPSWYRAGATRPRGPAQNQYRSGRDIPNRSRTAPVRPIRPVQPARPEVRPAPARPAVRVPPTHAEGLGLTGQTVRRESLRGESSRRAAPAPARPQARPAPQPRATPPARVAPAQNFLRPSDGRATEREAARGAASRRR